MKTVSCYEAKFVFNEYSLKTVLRKPYVDNTCIAENTSFFSNKLFIYLFLIIRESKKGLDDHKSRPTVLFIK